MLGDDALVLSQRLSEWCSRAPDLEEDIALANIALDLLGQARLLLARAAEADPSIVPVLPDGSPVPPEDALAFFREAHDFRNVRLVELANGDFAETIVRVLLFSTPRLAVFERLRASRDPVLRAVAAKGVKELAYHRDFAARWFVTLARGTRSRDAGWWPRSTRSGRCGPSSSSPRDRGRCWRRPVSASTRRRSATPPRRCSPRSSPPPTSPRPEVAAPIGRDRPTRPRRDAHRAAQPAARRDAGRRPRPPEGPVVS